jgi:hypothetical protein
MLVSAAARSYRGAVARRPGGHSRHARSSASGRCAHEYRRGRSGRANSARGVPAGPATIGLDQRPQRGDRDTLGGEATLHSHIRRGIAFELVINTAVAKAMSFEVPRSLVFRADKVIE